MKTCPSAQTLGFFDVDLRVQWLEAKGNPRIEHIFGYLSQSMKGF